MTREDSDGLPVALFTRRLTARNWDFATNVHTDNVGRVWSVTISPRLRRAASMWARIHIERADGRVERVWSSDPSSSARWTYERTIALEANEPTPSVVVYRSLLPKRVAMVRERWIESTSAGWRGGRGSAR